MNATAVMPHEHAMIPVIEAPAEAQKPIAAEMPDIVPSAWKWINLTMFLGLFFLAGWGGYIWWGFYRFQNCKPGF